MLKALINFKLNILGWEGAHNWGRDGRWGKHHEHWVPLFTYAKIEGTLTCLNLYDLKIGELVLDIFPYERTRFF